MAVVLTATVLAIALGAHSESHATGHVAVLQTDSAIHWSDMSHDERKEYMHDVVAPHMKKLFQEFDSVQFREVKCMFCHGDGAKNQSFKMPNPKLPKLPNSPDGWKALNAKKGKIMKFMSSTVKPEMAKLLGMPPFDPKTGKGFGCMDCHTSE